MRRENGGIRSGEQDGQIAETLEREYEKEYNMRWLSGNMLKTLLEVLLKLL